MTTISILANTVRPSVVRRSDVTAFGAETFSKQNPVNYWKAGPGDIMTVGKKYSFILFVTSNHLTFFHEYFSVLAVEKRSFYRSIIGFFSVWTKEKMVFFFNCLNWKKLGKTRLVVWWFDVTNKILLRNPKVALSTSIVVVSS